MRRLGCQFELPPRGVGMAVGIVVSSLVIGLVDRWLWLRRHAGERAAADSSASI